MESGDNIEAYLSPEMPTIVDFPVYHQDFTVIKERLNGDVLKSGEDTIEFKFSDKLVRVTIIDDEGTAEVCVEGHFDNQQHYIYFIDDLEWFINSLR